MNSLFTLVISFFMPGAGQLILKKYSKGFLILGLLFLAQFLNFIPSWASYIILMIWAVFDVHDHIEKLEGRKSATRKLAFSILIVVIIIPAILFLFFGGLFAGGSFLTNEYLNEDRTKKEMNEISLNLEDFKDHYGYYPENYNAFISKKPIWSGWKADSWNNPYKYHLKDSVNYQLISAGKDSVFDSKDDLERSN